MPSQVLVGFANGLVRQWQDEPLPIHPRLPAEHDSIIANGELPPGCEYRPWHWYSITKHRCWTTWKAGGTATCSLSMPPSWRKPNWWCANLREAAEHYSWHTGARLPTFGALSTTLQAQMAAGDLKGSATTCHQIFDWGGVARDPSSTSRSWVNLQAASGSLISTLSAAVQALQPNQGQTPSLGHVFGGLVPMNSATTKLFTAADPAGRVVMHDGRVGAATCLLAREYLRQQGIASVPPELDFLWGQAQSGPPGGRNPSDLPYKFRNMNIVSDLVRAEAGWRLNVVADLACSRLSISTRALETSLFMIGYRVRP